MYGDIVNENSAKVILGQYLYERVPEYLHTAEIMIDRYIDPCSLIKALGCSPFIWHPLISSLLVWPAAIVFLIMGVLFWFLSNLFQGFSRRQHRSYHRDGR